MDIFKNNTDDLDAQDVAIFTVVPAVLMMRTMPRIVETARFCIVTATAAFHNLRSNMFW